MTYSFLPLLLTCATPSCTISISTTSSTAPSKFEMCLMQTPRGVAINRRADLGVGMGVRVEPQNKASRGKEVLVLVPELEIVGAANRRELVESRLQEGEPEATAVEPILYLYQQGWDSTCPSDRITTRSVGIQRLMLVLEGDALFLPFPPLCTHVTPTCMTPISMIFSAVPSKLEIWQMHILLAVATNRQAH